jgi:hypothetical protein
VDEAAANIAEVLARESGQAKTPARRAAPARSAQAEPSPPQEEAETDPDEALGEDTGEAEEVDPEAGAGEEEATEEGEDTEEADEQQPRKFTVKIDGKEQQVDEAELVASYLRHSDYTRKTMAHAEERKAFQAEVQELRKERQQYAELLPGLAAQYEALMNPPIDWERLRRENLPEYIRQKEIQQDLATRRQAAADEQQRLQFEQSKQHGQQRVQLLSSEKEALEKAMPAWKDGAKWDTARAFVKKYLNEQGYNDQQVSDLVDHRAVIISWKAAQYDRMLKQGQATTVRPAPRQQPSAPSPAPGTNNVRRNVSQLTRDKQRLAKTHSVRDAAAVIRGLL